MATASAPSRGATFPKTKSRRRRCAARSFQHQEGASRRAETQKIRGPMIRKLPSGLYRLYSRKKNPKTSKRRNLGTFRTRIGALQHERAIQHFKRH
jgi:hypothetical protein